MARSLRLEPSSFRTACCGPVLVEVEAHEGLFKQGSLLQQVKRNVAAPASTLRSDLTRRAATLSQRFARGAKVSRHKLVWRVVAG